MLCPTDFLQTQVRPLRGPSGEYGAHGVVDIEQDASRVYDFMRQIEEQPKWNAGVKLSQVIGRVNQTTTHVKQVSFYSDYNQCVPLV